MEIIEIRELLKSEGKQEDYHDSEGVSFLVIDHQYIKLYCHLYGYNLGITIDKLSYIQDTIECKKILQ